MERLPWPLIIKIKSVQVDIWTKIEEISSKCSWEIFYVYQNGTDGCKYGQTHGQPENVNILKFYISCLYKKCVPASMWIKEFCTSGHVKRPSQMRFSNPHTHTAGSRLDHNHIWLISHWSETVYLKLWYSVIESLLCLIRAKWNIPNLINSMRSDKSLPELYEVTEKGFTSPITVICMVCCLVIKNKMNWWCWDDKIRTTLFQQN